MENNDIITTLETIKNYCENAYDCYDCPYDHTICFSMEPELWDIEKLKHKLLNGGEDDGN